jgi:uncharacterized protein (TIRG00374 family)
MKLNIRQVIFYTIFLLVGIYIFRFIYKEYDMSRISEMLKIIDYKWLVISLAFGILSHFIRALRWIMLIEPLGYKARVRNSFLAVLILYCVNIIVPRAGEVARCGVLKRYDNVPLASLIGTVIIERIADVIVLGLIALFVLIRFYEDILKFFNVNSDSLLSFDEIPILKLVIIGVAAILVGIVALRYLLNHPKIGSKVRELKDKFMDGIKAILKLKNRWLFIFYSLAIFVVYLFMLYFIFWAYPPTEHLTLGMGIVTFFMSALAMLAPIQAGIGPWHFMVISTLAIYGIDKPVGQDFALLAHTSTNMIYLIIGFVAFLLLPIVNKKV